jgi:hypothetical protein
VIGAAITRPFRICCCLRCGRRAIARAGAKKATAPAPSCSAASGSA